MNQDLHYDLSAAFDTIKGEILLERLRFRYAWFLQPFFCINLAGIYSILAKIKNVYPNSPLGRNEIIEFKLKKKNFRKLDL